MKRSRSTRNPKVFVGKRLEYLTAQGVSYWPHFRGGDETHDGVVLYLASELIACSDTTPFVEEELGRRFGRKVRRRGRQDFNIFELPDGVDSLDLASRLKCREANVAPHPVLNLAQGIPRIGPGDDPWPATAPAAAARVATARHRVGVVDTGVLKGIVKGASVSAANIDIPDAVAPTQEIDWYGAAHGTFIDGIYRQAGVTDIEHGKAVSNAGLVTLDSFIQKADAAVGSGISVLNLSLGLYRAPGLGIPGMRAAVRRWIEASGGDLLIAAAAGNDAKSQRFYPAGFSDDPEIGRHIMAVGALDHPDARGEKRPAEFSNFGEWVNAWAPGVDLVSGYAGGGLKYVYADGSSQGFGGHAHWSGTSFATPYAAAEVIRHAEATGVSPLAAWHDIRGGRPWVLFD